MKNLHFDFFFLYTLLLKEYDGWGHMICNLLKLISLYDLFLKSSILVKNLKTFNYYNENKV